MTPKEFEHRVMEMRSNIKNWNSGSSDPSHPKIFLCYFQKGEGCNLCNLLQFSIFNQPTRWAI